MNHVRRPSLLAEGEPLLLARSAIETAVRFTAYAGESGLPRPAVLSTPLCSMPLPIYTDFGTRDDGKRRRRWEGTRPEYMWHPLMWLPPRVAGRYQLDDPRTGESRLEDDDLWAIRVAFELTASGLYDPITGTWFDVLHTVGIDIEEPADVARVERWLNGAADEDLDSIDLSGYLDIDPSNWALETALALRDDLERASWALIADDLLTLADETVDNVDLPTAQRLSATRSLAGLGESLLSRVPNETEDGVATSFDGVTHLEFFTRLHGDTDLLTPDQVTGRVTDARSRLYAIRETYWPYVDSLSNLVDEDGVSVGD